MKRWFLLLLILSGLTVQAQTHISGKVTNTEGKPLPGANIYVKGSFDGTISDTSGKFNLIADTRDSLHLIVSFVGYQTWEKLLTGKHKQYTLDVKLTSESQNLNEVVINAGSFEASEKNRAVLLTPIDVATTASSDGDVYGALATFPGAQKQSETGRLIVRGGDSYESKTYIDGLLVSSPYISTMPDIPSRGRFSPFIFNGVMFSTGGYSAEYGQALSSVLELNTPGWFDENLTSISLMNVGLGLSVTRVYKRSCFSIDAGYNNLYLYFLLAKYNLDWIRIPESYNVNLYHRLKVGKTGLIKTNISLSHSYSRLKYKSSENSFSNIGMRDINILIKSNYNTELGKNWTLKTGVAYNANLNNKDIDRDKLEENLGSVHARMVLKNHLAKNISWKTGAELYNEKYLLSYTVDSSQEKYKSSVNDVILSSFLEGDIKLNNTLALRAGFRGEYSTYTATYNAAPRFSFSVKTGERSQISAATGIFYQQPQNVYLQYTHGLRYEKAIHALLNYQLVMGKRFFRIETYYKKYADLVTYQLGSSGEYNALANNGGGYAKGIDVFWKDNQSIPHLDYWISYSYIDSKRQYKDYPDEVMPEYVSKHNASLVLKYWIDPLHTEASLTYNFSSGRPYNDPNKNTFMSGRTPVIHDLSASLSYITNIFGNMTVVHLSVSNLFGQENIYSYHFSQTPDEFGLYESTPVKSPIQRTVIIGVFISVK